MGEVVAFQAPQRARQRRADAFPHILAQEDIDAAVLREQRARRTSKLKWAAFYAICIMFGIGI